MRTVLEDGTTDVWGWNIQVLAWDVTLTENYMPSSYVGTLENNWTPSFLTILVF